MAKRKKLRLVEVSWVDADHNAGWLNDRHVDDEEEEGQAYSLLVKKKCASCFLPISTIMAIGSACSVSLWGWCARSASSRPIGYNKVK